MAAAGSKYSSPKPALHFDTTHTFLSSYTSSSTPNPSSPPNSFTLLSHSSPLPPIPSDFPKPKLIPNTRFVVDAFRSAGDFSVSYFLTHFHSDHYAGLSPSWCRGVVFCSEVTGRLLVESLQVPGSFVVRLPVGEAVGVDGWEVTLVDANHCPGAVMLLFRLPGKEKYVHTGDFRFCDSMRLDPDLGGFVGADAIFLDTTYCNQRYAFPSQSDSIGYIVDTIEMMKAENANNAKMSVLFLIATYVVGKERILLEISRKCNCMVYVDGKKMAILRAIGLGDCGVFTEEESASDVHVIGWNLLGETWPYFRPNFVKMKEVMEKKGYTRAVGFVPTGWMYETKQKRFAVRVKDQFEIHLVPYSEHSSYSELREFVRFLRPKEVIPTVGLDVEKLDSKQAIAMKKHFVGLVDETAIKQEFLLGFYRESTNFTSKDIDASGCTLEDEMDTPGNLEQSSECSEHALADQADLKHTSGEQPCPEECNMQKFKNFDKLAQELRECLPMWVTRYQIFDLLSKSDGDVVGAVTDFYEREAELHVQLLKHRVSDFSCQTASTDITVLGSVPDNLPALSANKISKQMSKRQPFRDTTSPSKKYVQPATNPKRKAKQSPVYSIASKQSTITSFFGKHVPKSSNTSTSGSSAANECLDGGSEKGESHVSVLNLFMRITGENVKESDAIAIVENAKGNLNVALDSYYSNIDATCSIPEKINLELVGTQLDVSVGCNKKRKRMTDIDVAPAHEHLTADINMYSVQLPVEKYSPVDHACWGAGQPAPYLHLARTFDFVERERGKIKATGMLCNMFRSLLALSPEDVLPAVYLCTNKIADDHLNVELNVGGSLVSAALEEACGTNRSRIRELYNKFGDLGDVAQHCRQTQSLLAAPCPLTIQELFSTLQKISMVAGSRSVARKKSSIVNLMRSCREKEIKFLVRTLVRNMRIGAMLRTILPSLAQAVVLNSCPNLHGKGDEHLKGQLQAISESVIQAYNILPSLDLLVPSLMSRGIDFSSSSLSMTPGVPIKPMLARITNGVSQVLKLFQGKAFTCEYKYDGQRAQIHKITDGSVRVFSRNGEETTSRFPDLVDIITDCCSPACETCILDAEVVAIDRMSGNRLLSFQKLSSRERGSRDSIVTMDSIKVDICVFIFDVMFYNGQQLLMIPLRQRRKFLIELFNEEKAGYFEFAKEITVEADESCLSDQATLSKINSFLEDAWNSSCEGIIVKTLDVDAGYAASKRTDTWLKVKRDYVEGMSDSLDLVPIGAWYGNGRKAGWYSPFLMACYNPEAEEYQSVCRVMSGFSDIFYSETKEFFSGEKILSKKPVYYQTAEAPDVWFSPELVWEIRGADFTISPVHHAAIGLVHPSRGISIRFPRFVRSIADRKPEDCSTDEDVSNMYKSQTRKTEIADEE